MTAIGTAKGTVASPSASRGGCNEGGDGDAWTASSVRPRFHKYLSIWKQRASSLEQWHPCSIGARRRECDDTQRNVDRKTRKPPWCRAGVKGRVPEAHGIRDDIVDSLCHVPLTRRRLAAQAGASVYGKSLIARTSKDHDKPVPNVAERYRWDQSRLPRYRRGIEWVRGWTHNRGFGAVCRVYGDRAVLRRFKIPLVNLTGFLDVDALEHLRSRGALSPVVS